MPEETPKTSPRPGPRLVPTRRTPEPMERNPYAPPRAELERKPAEDAGEWRERGVVAPALHGLVWIRDAWRIFWEQPWTWCGACALGAFFAWLLDMIPVVGDYPLEYILWPIFGGGLALMAHSLSEGEDIHVLEVFGGFRACFPTLALLGVPVFLGMMVLAQMPSAAKFLMELASVKVSFKWQGITLSQSLSAGGLFLICLVGLPQLFPPVLAAVAGRGFTEALLVGMGAMLKNWKALLLNGVVLVCIHLCLTTGGLLLPLLLAKTAANFGSAIRDSCFHASLSFFELVLNTCIGLFYLMSYTATRDIFYNED